MTFIHYKLNPVPHGTSPKSVCGAVTGVLTTKKSDVDCKDCLAWAKFWWGSVEKWRGKK